MAGYLLINHDLKLILAFSPKCACQTLRWWFLRSTGMVEVPAEQRVDAYLLAPRQLESFPNYRKVQIIRDPLRRLVSFYGHWVVRDEHHWCFADEQRRFSLRGKTFRRFLYVLEHLHSRGLQFQHHLLPQLDHGSIDRFDQIILLDNLEHELGQLGDELGLAFSLQSFNRATYSQSPCTPAFDRAPIGLREQGMPPADWFYDGPARELALRCYREDADCYLQAGGQLLNSI